MHTKTLIIGSGPAGYTAALYAARANLNPLMIMGDVAGGQLLYTHKIENFPGIQDISGSALIDVFHNQIEHLGVNVIYENVVSVDFQSKPFLCVLSNKEHVTADSVIIACGSKAKWLNIAGEEEFKGRGISVCATCDGFFYKGARVAVIGGGNTAMYESLFLSSVAQSVILINRTDTLTGEKSLCEKVLNNPKIQILNNTQVIRFLGQNKLTGIEIKAAFEEESTLDIDGAFVAIGQVPQTEMFKGQIAIDSDGFILTDTHKRTSVDGVFAAGDIQEKTYRQAVIACGSGAIAALSAEKYLTDAGFMS